MTTPNGQHPQDPPELAEQTASTVLALDGWGPLIPEPLTNGVVEELVDLDENITDIVEQPTPRWQWEPTWDLSLPRMAVLLPGPAMLAPAAAIGLTLGVAVGTLLRWWQQRQVVAAPTPPPPPSRAATFRRSLALAIDPALAEPCPPPSWRELLLPSRR